MKQQQYHFLEVCSKFYSITLAHSLFSNDDTKYMIKFHFYIIFCLIIEFINFTQPLYVWREDSDSRQSTIKGIIDRASAKGDWPQVRLMNLNQNCLKYI